VGAEEWVRKADLMWERGKTAVKEVKRREKGWKLFNLGGRRRARRKERIAEEIFPKIFI